MADVEGAETQAHLADCNRAIHDVGQIEDEPAGMPSVSPGRQNRSEIWVIKEGINFVQGFDQAHMALIMTVRLKEAKRFPSRSEGEFWIDQYGKDLDPSASLTMILGT